MKRLFQKKIQKITKGMPSAVVLSILIHVGLFLLAGMLVVFTVVKKDDQKFEPPKAVERPKMKLKKPKVKVKKTSKPKPTTRIVTKVNRASMPDIQLPEMSGMGEGLGGGIGGFDMMPELDTVSLMGSGQSIGNDLEGTFYDFKRDRSGRPIPYAADTYRDIVRRFMKGGWKTSLLSRYYQAPKKLYATAFVIPPVLSEIAPEAFGEADTEGNFWMAHYKGQLVHKEGITFRFIGSGDEIFAVRVAGRITMASAWRSVESQILGDIWTSSSADSRKFYLGNQEAVMGDWITLEPGVPVDMEVIMTDNGGQACLMLAVEEKGVEYERRIFGGPTWPAFKTSVLSHSMLDAIYKDLVEGELCLTNGPVFNDYSTGGGPTVTLQDAAVTNEASFESGSDSPIRMWTSVEGKTIEGEFVMVMGEQVVLRNAKGTRHKISLAQLSPEDHEYIGLARPPKLAISFSRKSNPKYAIIDGGSSGVAVGYFYTYTAKLKQTSAGKYNHPLDVEFFAIGEEIHGEKYVLLDRQKSRFVPSKENDRSHNFSGEMVELPNFILDGIHRGLKDSGCLVVVTDQRGKIIEYYSSQKWLFEHLDNLTKLPVGSYMDKACTRVYPTGPKRTRY